MIWNPWKEIRRLRAEIKRLQEQQAMHLRMLADLERRVRA